jgi:hypothetical protein
LVHTNLPGGYSVFVDADGVSPFAGAYSRRVRLGFYLPDGPDGDGDRLPDWWEIEHGTNPTVPDANQDPDGDGLPNSQEYFRKTHPLDPDTDDGGENDGSEVGRQNDPLFPADDGVHPPTFKPWPGVGKAILRLLLPATFDRYIIERAPSMNGPFLAVVSDTIHLNEWVDPTVMNGQSYCYRLIIEDVIGEGDETETARATSQVQCTTPNADPHPPHGVVTSLESTLAQAAAASTTTPEAALLQSAVPLTVRLLLDATDDPTTEEHPAFDGAFLFADAERSGVAEMIIANRADFEGALWEPYTASKLWTLAPNDNGLATVFVKFRDAVGNVSDLAHETFVVDESLPPHQTELFLPMLGRD